LPLSISKRERVSIVVLLARDTVIVQRSTRQMGCIEKVTKRITSQFAPGQMVGMVFVERFEVVLHLIRNFHVECGYQSPS